MNNLLMLLSMYYLMLLKTESVLGAYEPAPDSFIGMGAMTPALNADGERLLSLLFDHEEETFWTGETQVVFN